MIWGGKNPYFWVFPPICLFASFLPPQTKPRIPRKKTLGSSEPFVDKKQVQLKRSPPRRNGWLGEGVGWCLCGGGRLKIKLWVYIYIIYIYISDMIYMYDIYIYDIYIYICGGGGWSLKLWIPGTCLTSIALAPPKQGRTSNQNKGHLGSRYIYIYTYGLWYISLYVIFFMPIQDYILQTISIYDIYIYMTKQIPFTSP